MANVPAPLPPSTANWHWKNKNVTRWSREWFERELLSISVTGTNQGEVVSISNVINVDGDVELGQRKSKLITIYDTKISLSWIGTASDGTEVNGSLTIPEVSHETTLDGSSDYTYRWTLSTASSPAVDALFELAKTGLPPLLEAKFTEFPKAIIESHGRDLTVSTEPSRAATPSGNGSTNTPNTFKTSATSTDQTMAVQKPAANLSTRTVHVEANFQASADDLFSLFTDEKRIPAWSRAPAQSTPQPGAGYSLFGGGVKGQYVSLTPAKEIVQTWELRSPTWPAGHFATLTVTFDQSSDSTKVTFSLAGVPVGQQDEIKRNLEAYYIHGLKSIGLGSEL
jgi:activator of HSP90 ATPase